MRLISNANFPLKFFLSSQIWQLTDTEYSEELVLTGHEDQVYSLAWSQCGKYIATACKDGKIRSGTFIHSNEQLKKDFMAPTLSDK